MLNLSRPRDAVKICLADHALRASWLQEMVPRVPEALATSPELAKQASHLAKNVVDATASVIRNLDTDRMPARTREPESELDFVFRVGDQQIPM